MVLIGQNSSGKTALLQAVAQRISRAVPHRDILVRPEQPDNPRSRVVLRFVASGLETRDATLREGFNLQAPIPNGWPSDPRKAADLYFNSPEIHYSAWYTFDKNTKHIGQVGYPSNGFNGTQALQLRPNLEKNGFADAQITRQADNVASFMIEQLRQRIYFFDAHRTPRSSSRYGLGQTLASNAENLAECLQAFQADRTAYAEYLELVGRVLPSVRWVSVDPAPSDAAEIKIWNVDESTRRTDLKISLEHCGSGIGQVLAMLYVVSKSAGDVIVIDEPNSFLHPRATKALLKIFRESTQHQFIISTHSAEVLVAARPDELFMLRLESENTTIKSVPKKSVEASKQVLNEIGASLSDVFGVDNVIWVEGPTEAECFPMLLGAAKRNTDPQTAIAPLRNTGDLEGRHAQVVADIYRNLSSAGSLLPVTVAISLDGDKASGGTLAMLQRACGDVLYLLPRWTYENYLVDPEALAATMNELPTFTQAPTNEKTVRDWINSHGNDKRYGATDSPVFSLRWMVSVNASKLLEDLFETLSDAKETFQKPTHSAALTEWILKDKPNLLKDLIDYVSGLIPEVGANA